MDTQVTGLKAALGFLPSVWPRHPAARTSPWQSVYRTAITLTIMTSMGMAQPCGAQNADKAKAGRDLAEGLCTACHRIGANDRDIERTPPDFGAIADMSSMTEVSLRVILRTPHGEMPRYQFSPSEMDDLIAYLQSLRSR